MSHIGDDLIAGMQNALAYVEGDTGKGRRHEPVVPDDVDVRAVRERLGLSQTAFSRRYGFAVSAVRDWEQGRRRPHRTARILLRVIEHDPRAVDAALAG